MKGEILSLETTNKLSSREKAIKYIKDLLEEKIQITDTDSPDYGEYVFNFAWGRETLEEILNMLEGTK